MRQIAIYGKGGIGKSTIVQNVAAALGEAGHSVMVIGCDPKADCTGLLTGKLFGSTVLDELRNQPTYTHVKTVLPLEKIIQEGCFGIKCVEAGGPEPGVGCAGRGIITAINLLEREEAFTEDLEYVIYDVLGDVVCGGFAMPIREGKAKEIYVVTSGEMMSLYAANNIAKGVLRFARTGAARIGGLICNNRNVAAESDLVEMFAKELGTQVIGTIPRDNIVQKSEVNQQTVITYAPRSEQAKVYRRLAATISGNTNLSIPMPIARERLMEMLVSLVHDE
jgi:nitrogenase iron protein NifH